MWNVRERSRRREREVRMPDRRARRSWSGSGVPSSGVDVGEGRSVAVSFLSLTGVPLDRTMEVGGVWRQ
jgi:hypothetical protein